MIVIRHTWLATFLLVLVSCNHQARPRFDTAPDGSPTFGRALFVAFVRNSPIGSTSGPLFHRLLTDSVMLPYTRGQMIFKGPLPDPTYAGLVTYDEPETNRVYPIVALKFLQDTCIGVILVDSAATDQHVLACVDFASSFFGPYVYDRVDRTQAEISKTVLKDIDRYKWNRGGWTASIYYVHSTGDYSLSMADTLRINPVIRRYGINP